MNPNQLILACMDFFQTDAKRIQHFIKVYEFARLIGEEEHLSEEELTILQSAAIVHDVGIRPAEEQYQRCDGKLQEQLGPKEAEKLLQGLFYSQDIIDRVCYLVGHHHTYQNIDGIDYQILVEADFLVNLYEDEVDARGIEAAERKIFRTKTGKALLLKMFGAK